MAKIFAYSLDAAVAASEWLGGNVVPKNESEGIWHLDDVVLNGTADAEFVWGLYERGAWIRVSRHDPDYARLSELIGFLLDDLEPDSWLRMFGPLRADQVVFRIETIKTFLRFAAYSSCMAVVQFRDDLDMSHGTCTGVDLFRSYDKYVRGDDTSSAYVAFGVENDLPTLYQVSASRHHQLKVVEHPQGVTATLEIHHIGDDSDMPVGVAAVLQLDIDGTISVVAGDCEHNDRDMFSLESALEDVASNLDPRVLLTASFMGDEEYARWITWRDQLYHVVRASLC